jgi:cation-transporting ATPase E
VVTAGLSIVIALEAEPGRRRYLVCGLCALMALGFLLVAAIPAGREFFELASPSGGMLAAWAIGSAVAIVLLVIALRLVTVLDRRASTRSEPGAGTKP